MSATARWSYKNTATVWPAASRDINGKPTFGAPYTICCTFNDTGDTQTGNDGKEFVPQSTFWTEKAGIKRGDFIIKGNSKSEPDPSIAGAAIIQKVSQMDMSFFNESADYEVFT